MNVLSILLFFIIPIIAIAIIVAVGLSKKLSPTNVFICALPAIISAALGVFFTFVNSFVGMISLLILLIGIIISIVLLVIKLQNCKTATVSQNTVVTATAVSKRYDVKDGNVSYCISFNVDGNGLVEFSLPLSQFENISEGDTGMLTYRGSVFFSFQK